METDVTGVMGKSEKLYSNKTICALSLVISILFVALFCFFVYSIPSALSRFFPVFQAIGFYIVYTIAFISALYLGVMSASILAGREILKFVCTRIVWFGYILPILMAIFKLFRQDENTLVRSFIALNNRFVQNELAGASLTGKDILILLPHCLQLDSCSFKITSDINNCRQCGKCSISRFLELSDKLELNIFVSTGGTLARKIVKEQKPALILAVACERDLTSGIRDTLPMPVIGVLNERPNGPCFNTIVDIDLIEKTLAPLIGA